MVLRAVTLAACASLSAAATPSIPHCTDFIAPISASARNLVDIPDPTKGLSPSSNATRLISGTFHISFRFCEPTAQNASGADVLQILVHGAMYGKNYWLWPQEPETYSYGRAANARGYPVLAYDRLGASPWLVPRVNEELRCSRQRTERETGRADSCANLAGDRHCRRDCPQRARWDAPQVGQSLPQGRATRPFTGKRDNKWCRRGGP